MLDTEEIQGALPVFCHAFVRDRAGVVVHESHTPSYSFLQQFFQWLYVTFGLVVPTSINTVLGSTSTIIGAGTWIECEAAATVTNLGIIVGTNTGAVAFANSSLTTRIPHGTASGQLQYGGSVVGQPASDAAGTSVIFTRDFSNASGAEVIVGEVGVYAQEPQLARSIAILRDTANISVPDGGTLTFNYELRTVL